MACVAAHDDSPVQQEEVARVFGSRGLVPNILSCVRLLKLRIVALLLFVSLAAALVAGGGTPTMEPLLLLVITGTLSAGGAGVLNHYLERDLDRLMERTSGRPLASGSFPQPRVALILGLFLIAFSAIVALPLNPWVAIFNTTGAFVYVVIYTLWLKRRSSWNIVIGGLAGSCAILSGGAAVGEPWTFQSLGMSLLLFLWTPPHFWSLAILRVDDYRAARVPMLPVTAGPRAAARWGLLHVLLLVGVSVALARDGSLGSVYVLSAMVAGCLLIATAVRLALRPNTDAARLHFRACLIYIAAIFGMMILDVLL